MKKYYNKRLYIKILLVVILILMGKPISSTLKIITAYASKSMVSQVFVAKRDPLQVAKTDNALPLIKWAKTSVDTIQKTATSTIFGFFTTTSIYRQGLGGLLINNDLKMDKPFLTPRRKQKKIVGFPYRGIPSKDTIFLEINRQKLQQVVQEAFKETDIRNPKNTRALLIVYKDCIIAEEYAKGFDKNTPMLGWSLTKSLMATVLGAMKRDIKYNLYQPLCKDFLFGIWREQGKDSITLANILQMNIGLSWEEDYTKVSDVTKCLYMDSDATVSQLHQPKIHPTGVYFNYSTGVSNLITLYIKSRFKNLQAYLDYPYKILIDKIGMYHTLVEADGQGNYISGAYGWASARDWARLGLLYLHKGIWNGQRILDEDWVEFVKTPSKSSDKYGGHFWTNARGTLYPDASEDVFSANGHNGQRIIIIPSKDLVIVRNGLTPSREKDKDLNKMTNQLIKDILTIFN